MKVIKSLIDRIADKKSQKETISVYKQWDVLRANAITPSHRAEIDAIFSRNL